MCIVRHKEADDHCIPSPNQRDIGPVAWLNEGNVKMSRQPGQGVGPKPEVLCAML